MLNQSVFTLLILLFSSLIIPFMSSGAIADDLTVSAYVEDFQQDARPGEWKLRMQFNKPVFGANLVQALSATTGATAVQLEILNTKNVKVENEGLTDFYVVPKQPSQALAPIVVKIRKGFSDTSGRSRLAKDFSYTFIPVQQVSIVEVEPYYNNKTDRGIIVTLSDPVEKRDLEKSVKISPKVSGIKFVRDNSRRYRVTGNFKFNENYTLETTPAPLDSGRAVLEANTFGFSGPGISNQISSQTTGNIIELRSRQLFPAVISGVTTIRAQLTRVPAVMIPDISDFFSAGAPPVDKPWEWMRETYQTLKSDNLVKKQFLSEIDMSSDAFFSPESKDRTRPYSLPLSFRKQPDQGGSWVLQLSDPDNNTTPEFVQLIQITDMSISYKLSEKSLVIWVTSINEGLPLADVEVMVRGQGQSTYYLGKTDQNGLITLQEDQEALDVSDEDAARLGNRGKIKISGLSWVIVATDNDSCAIKIDNFRIKPFVWNQQADSTKGVSKETGYLFTERGVYRPGEIVHFKFISRIYENDQILAPQGSKVTTEIVSPRGDVLYSRELTLNEFGSCFDDFQSEQYMPLGTYTINSRFLNNPDQKSRFTQTFMLQQFKEPRHLVSLSVKTEKRKAPEYVGLDINEEILLVDASCRYYAGGPVRNGRVRWKIDLVPASVKVKGYEGFFFGNSNPDSRFLESGESNLDGHGNLVIRVPLDTRLLTGVYGVKVSVTALDIDGEPATEVTTFNPKPKYLIGLSENPSQVQPGYMGSQKFVVLSSDGNPVSQAPVQITWLQKKYLYLQKRDDQGNMVDSWEEGWIKTFSSSQTTRDGEGRFEVELNQPGDYMVNVAYENNQVQYASQTTYSVGWEDYERWMRSQGPGLGKSVGELVLSLNRKDFEHGETIQASSNTPKPIRKVLATIERDRVIEAMVVDANGKNIKFSFPVTDGFRPNVFVGAMAPSGRQNFPVYYNQADSDIPSIYSGYANASIRTDAKKIKIEIEPEVKELKAKPGAETSISFRAQDQTGKGIKCEMAVCVVNEAVLALTGFKTPDLSSLADFNLALSVLTGDLRVGLVSQDLLKILGTRPVTGGGVGAGLVTPSLRKDFRPVAFFDPSIITSDSGEARIQFKLPDTTTAYRVYVVAADKSSGFASAQKNLVASKEFSLEPSTPRFLCFGDKATFPLVVSNAMEKQGSVRIQAKGSDELKIKLKTDKIDVPPLSNISTPVFAEVEAGTESGTVTFIGDMVSPDGNFQDGIEKKIPIASRHSPVNSSTTGDFTGKTDIKAVFPEYVKTINSGDLTGKVFSATLDLSVTNWARLAPSLNYLITYPFGCIEQTSSGLFPMVGMKSLAAQNVIPNLRPDDLDRFIKSGIDKILSMQLSSGAFSYWPGQNYASYWGTVYATYALEKAHQAGYVFPQDSVKKALKYIRDNIFKFAGKSDENDQDWIKGWAILTLAEGKSLSQNDFEPIFKNYPSADDETRILILLAAKKINYLPDSKLKAELKSLKITDHSAQLGLRGSTWRKQAALLMAIVDLEGHSPQADSVAGKLIKGLKPDGSWSSTADTGWCLMALSKYYGLKSVSHEVGADVTISYGMNETKTVKLGQVGAHVSLSPQTLLAHNLISLKSDSKALVNYNLNIVYPETDNKMPRDISGIEISKTVENLNGKKEIRLGDIVKITLDINLTNKKPGAGPQIYEYLALEDFVPAGLYPINTRIATEGVDTQSENEQGDDYFSSSSNLVPTYVEFRDEGVRVFKNKLYDGSYRFSYLARAVTQGEFWMRGSRLSLMYEPSRHSRTEGKKMVISPSE